MNNERGFQVLSWDISMGCKWVYHPNLYRKNTLSERLIILPHPFLISQRFDLAIKLKGHDGVSRPINSDMNIGGIRIKNSPQPLMALIE